MGKEFTLWFALFVLLFVVRVIFIWSNFEPCFIQSTDGWVLIEIFLFSSFTYQFFNIKIFFSHTTTYDIHCLLLYVIYVTRLHLYFFCCSLDYITRLLIYRYSIVSGGCLIHFRLCCLHHVIIHPETLVAEEKKNE